MRRKTLCTALSMFLQSIKIFANQIERDPGIVLGRLQNDKKVSFDGNTASFNNSYFCYKMLPRDLMFAHLEHNNSGNNFTPSKMMTLKQNEDSIKAWDFEEEEI